MTTFLSVCSGIEAASVAWNPLGWEALAFSEIAAFPSAVLKHHYPDVPNFGDLNGQATWAVRQPDVLIGGTPCQSFSVAGKRGGLADPRGRLMLAFLGLAERLRPRWVVWENVPGVLSSNGGRDFGTFLGALGQLGYGWAYRVLDAQWFGVPQRRRRVFVVACSRADVSRAGAVLFECESVCRDSAPRREAWQDDSGSTGDGLARCLRGEGSLNKGIENSNYVIDRQGSTGDGLARCLTAGERRRDDWETCNFVYSVTPAHARGECLINEVSTATAITATEANVIDRGIRVVSNARVRRLTATECERLQGFPDGYTGIPWRRKPESPDGLRIAALGNSMAVPVVRWIGQRIDAALRGGRIA